ncbi:MAG: LamG-like jellyroll fold domain-containing protein [Bacteroidia bacterium]
MKTNLFLTAALSLSLCAASTAQNLPFYLPTDGLVGWWPFNGNANDESGNGNNGTVNGATLTEDRFGVANAAYSFDGNGNYISIADNANLLLENTDFSISSWILPLSESNGHILYKGFSSGNSSKYIFAMYNQSIGFHVNPPFNIWILSDSIPLGTWQLATITKQGNLISFYRNGEIYGEQTLNYPIPNTSGVAARIGGAEPNGGGGWNGLLDDIGIWNRALTQDEITALYTGEPVNPPTACNPLPANLQNGLVGYWPFCGNANDESGNGNDGTVNGATLNADRFGIANSAYRFNGTSQFIEIADDSVLDVSDSYSINCWVEISDYTGSVTNTGGIRTMISKPRTQNGTGLAFRVFEGTNNYNSPDRQYLFGINDGAINAGVVSNDTVPLNTWTLLTYTYDGAIARLYRNGILRISQEIDYQHPNSSQPFLFGKEFGINSSEARWYKGLLDDIGIWNRALTPDEVQQLYTLNACTFTIYDTVTVTQTVYDTVSVSVSTTDTLIINPLITAVQPAQENTFLVYPNPAGSQITINNGNVGILGGYTMRITNSAGQEVYNQNITQTEVTLDLGNWGGNGLYVLYITDPQDEIIAVKQIVLQ